MNNTTNRQPKVEFDRDSVEHFRFVHRRAPRGVGVWVFGLHRNGSMTTVWIEGSFTTARSAAMREARSLGCDTVTVQP